MANPTIIPKKSVIAGAVPTSSQLTLGEIAINHEDAVLYSRHPSTGAVYALTGGGGGGPTTINDLDEMFTTARANYYHEVNYNVSGDVSDIQVYDDALQTTHLYSRAFTYDGSGNITAVTTTDQQNAGVSLTKTISYNGSGDIATVTRNYVL